MNPTFPSNSLLLSFLFLLLLYPYNGKSQTLIQKVCNDASKDSKYMTYEFCLTALQTDPSSKHESFEGLGLIALKLDRTNMSRLESYIKNMLKYRKFNDSYVKEALKDCVEHYSDGIESVKVATMAYKVRDYGTANVQMSAAFDSVFDCEDGFNERGRGVVSPLKKLNQVMISVNALALYFTYELSQGGYKPRND
ncbi:putative invertase inhibitor [Macadamia integrifolia]|uniref:putative invertase inhibitor n=1 Tax=Macadamia integrifolia TaxID=60698 RepID=UPI001C4E7206|nr:putative invertase inhibitor [Macadamia integrifolia]